MNCHRCRKSITDGDRAPMRFRVRRGQALEVVRVPAYHVRCVPPALWKRDGYDRLNLYGDNSDDCPVDPASVGGPSLAARPAHPAIVPGRKF